MSAPTWKPTVTQRSIETTLSFDPHDPIEAVEVEAWTRTRTRARFRLAYLTVHAADGDVWKVHASGPRVDESGLVAGGDVGYLSTEWSEISEYVPAPIAELVRAELAR